MWKSLMSIFAYFQSWSLVWMTSAAGGNVSRFSKVVDYVFRRRFQFMMMLLPSHWSRWKGPAIWFSAAWWNTQKTHEGNQGSLSWLQTSSAWKQLCALVCAWQWQDKGLGKKFHKSFLSALCPQAQRKEGTAEDWETQMHCQTDLGW